ncbi:MAG: hypothetical protein N3A54_00165 [Patescibacteria group bacterium]|nr:hypothetical protein [Patescibacteria group bacterium]
MSTTAKNNPLLYLVKFRSISDRPVSKKEEEFLNQLTSRYNIRVNRKLYPFLIRLVKNERNREGYLRVFGRLTVINSLLRDVDAFLKRENYTQEELITMRDRVKRALSWLKKRSGVNNYSVSYHVTANL